MSRIYAGLVAPEKHGVTGTRWMTIEGDTLIVTNLKVHKARVEHLKQQGHEVVYLDNDAAREMVKALT